MKVLFLEIFSLIVFSICFNIVVTILSIGNVPRINSDYDANFPIYIPFIHDLRKGKFELNNNFVGYGISLLSDPLSFVFNPIYTLPILIFNQGIGYRLVIFIVTLISMINMWILMVTISKNIPIKLVFSILFGISGAISARISAGHIQQILSYIFLPIFVYGLLFTQNLRKQLILIFVFSYFVYCGDLYTTWLSFVLYISSIIYKLCFEQGKKLTLSRFIFVTTGFLTISSIRLVPFLFDVYPTMHRFFPIYPFAGSIDIWLFFLPFIMPFSVSFYDRPGIQRILGFYYNWYEYYAFISPFVILPLLYITKIWRNRTTKLLAVILITGALYIAMRHIYSPFYYLFTYIPQLQVFRVPQRMYMVLVPFLLLLSAYCMEYLRNTKIKLYRIFLGLLVLGVICTSIISIRIIIASYEPQRTIEKETVEWLRKTDPGKYFVATFVCCMQYYLVSQEISVMNYYYGWKKNDLPTFVKEGQSDPDFSVLSYVRPRYIIAPLSYNLDIFEYQKIYLNSHIVLWKTNRETIFPN